MRGLVLALALSGGAARAQDGGVPEGLVIELKSGVVTLPSGAVRSIDAGLYLDVDAAMRSARELAALRAEVVAWRTQPPPQLSWGWGLLGLALFVGGLATGFFLPR